MTPKIDFVGFYITYQFYGNDGVESKAAVVIGENFESIANRLFKEFSVDDDIYAGEKTIGDVMKSIENYISNEYPYDKFQFFSYKYWEMKPKVGKELLKNKELLDTPACLKLGRDHFSDFDSVMGK